MKIGDMNKRKKKEMDMKKMKDLMPTSTPARMLCWSATLALIISGAVAAEAPPPSAGNALVDTLANAMFARRGAIEEDEEDDWSDDDSWLDD